jgi:hypothetical protein
MTMNRDRKDTPAAGDEVGQHADETVEQREARKKAESAALDQALEKSFPGSDPVLPFVPAVAATGADADASSGADDTSGTSAPTCAHTACTCDVQPPEIWCSDACRDRQQGFADATSACGCAHAACTAD